MEKKYKPALYIHSGDYDFILVERNFFKDYLIYYNDEMLCGKNFKNHDEYWWAAFDLLLNLKDDVASGRYRWNVIPYKEYRDILDVCNDQSVKDTYIVVMNFVESDIVTE
jgi:hypothetical protein